jgi:hypothetical protein
MRKGTPSRVINATKTLISEMTDQMNLETSLIAASIKLQTLLTATKFTSVQHNIHCSCSVNCKSINLIAASI